MRRQDACLCVCVYYRVQAADVAAAAAAVLAVQRRHGTGELLRRPGICDGHVTLMEVYRAGGSAAGAAGAAEAAAAAAVQPWLDGSRHVEVFEPFDL